MRACWRRPLLRTPSTATGRAAASPPRALREQLYDLMTMGFKYQLLQCSHAARPRPRFAAVAAPAAGVGSPSAPSPRPRSNTASRGHISRDPRAHIAARGAGQGALLDVTLMHLETVMALVRALHLRKACRARGCVSGGAEATTVTACSPTASCLSRPRHTPCAALCRAATPAGQGKERGGLCAACDQVVQGVLRRAGCQRALLLPHAAYGAPRLLPRQEGQGAPVIPHFRVPGPIPAGRETQIRKSLFV